MNIQEATTHPLVDHARKELWGTGIITIPPEFEADFYLLAPEDQQLVRAFFTAAATSCPVPVRLLENPKYGPDYLEERYTSISFWFRFLKEGVLKDTSFGEPVDLTNLGGRGTAQDDGWIPAGRESCLVGPSTYEGHVLSRQIIDIIIFSKKYGLDVAEEMTTALDLIAATPNEPIRAIASLAVYMHILGFGEELLRDRLFDVGYRKETPERYWRPILDYLNTILPDNLQYKYD